MIPRITLLLLLSHSAIALAQPLYKWVEPDGSITFSPQPPVSGVEYERLEAGSPAAKLAESANTEAARTDKSAEAAVSSSASPAEPLPRVEYAPGNETDLPPAISRASAAKGASVRPVTSALAVGQSRSEAELTSDGLAASVSAANFKRGRCQDLKKRVTSLERRLKSRLTPEDMDNTVIHMARYQRSFDQYCAQ